MGSLRAGKRSNWVGLNRCRWFSQSDIDMLVTKKFHQLAPMGASLPISKDAPDEKPMEVKGPLGQVGTHLKSAHRSLVLSPPSQTLREQMVKRRGRVTDESEIPIMSPPDETVVEPSR